MQKTVVVVAGVIFDRSMRLLACQRPPGKSHAGKWEFPGGKLEKGENAAAALRRELAEELDIRVTVLDEMYRLTVHPAPDKELILHFLRALAPENCLPTACEGQQFRWLKKNELDSVDWLETDWEFVKFLALTENAVK